MSDLNVIERALQDLEWVRMAPARYATVMRTLQELRATGEPLLTEDAMTHMLRVRELERELDRLAPVVADPAQFKGAALRALRAANGVETVGIVTAELGSLALKRLKQGYKLRQVADMIGCAPSTVSNIKAGRYRYSDLPTTTKHGARGRRHPA